MIEFLEKNLNPQAFALLLLCVCVIYIWYLHLRNKLLKEQIEFEKEKRENFLNELQKLKNAPPSKRIIYKKTSKPKHILIVDDETWLREMIISVLSQHYPGIQLSEASDGVEALEVIALNKPSVLITDVMMPRIGIISFTNPQSFPMKLRDFKFFLGAKRRFDALRAFGDDLKLWIRIHIRFCGGFLKDFFGNFWAAICLTIMARIFTLIYKVPWEKKHEFRFWMTGVIGLTIVFLIINFGIIRPLASQNIPRPALQCEIVNACL